MPFHLCFLASTGHTGVEILQERYRHLSSLDEILSLSWESRAKCVRTGNKAFLAERTLLRDFAIEQCSNKDQETFQKFAIGKKQLLTRSKVHNKIIFFSQTLNTQNYPKLLSPLQQDFDSVKESSACNPLENFLLLLLVFCMDFSQQ